MCSKCTGEHPCLFSGKCAAFFFGTPFPRNTSGGLLSHLLYLITSANLIQTRNILEKSNLRCCQSFLNSLGDFRDHRNRINQVPPEILSFGWMKLFQCRNQWYQSIGHHKRMKEHKNTYHKTSPLPQLSALNPIMHEIFKVAFAHWGVNLPNVLSKFSMTKTEELKLCVNSKYYKNFCFKWLPVNMLGFLLTSAIFFLVDENRIVLLLKQPHILSY